MTAFTTAYPGVIKSIQYGTISIGAAATSTATITSVDTTKSVVNYLGWSGGENANYTNQTARTIAYTARLTLTNATTVTLTKNSTYGLEDILMVVSFVVVEYS